MDIDTVLGNTKQPTKAELNAGLGVLMAVSETIREAGECPSGTIYAALVGRVTLQCYEKILGILKGAGLIEVAPSHLIRWIGPKVQA